MSETYEWSMKVSAPWSSITGMSSGKAWLDGEVHTPQGIVIVYSQGHDDDYSANSNYRIIIDGREYGKTENVARTGRGLAIMAGRWARELVSR